MTQTTLYKIVTHAHVSMFGIRYRNCEFVAECFLRRDVTITSRTGNTPEEAIEALWTEINRQFPTFHSPSPSYPMPPGL